MSPDEIRLSLRKKGILVREQLSPEERAEKSRRTVERIAALPEFQRAAVVLLYRAVRGELCLDALPACPAAAGKRFVYPRCGRAFEMTARLPGRWVPGAFGIPEPAEDAVIVPPEEISLVLCPGTAFDDHGSRLGMGAGYYDRYLPKCVKAAVWMAAFEIQRAEFIPPGPFDFPMDGIVTESAVRRIPKGGPLCV